MGLDHSRGRGRQHQHPCPRQKIRVLHLPCCGSGPWFCLTPQPAVPKTAAIPHRHVSAWWSLLGDPSDPISPVPGPPSAWPLCPAVGVPFHSSPSPQELPGPLAVAVRAQGLFPRRAHRCPELLGTPSSLSSLGLVPRPSCPHSQGLPGPFGHRGSILGISAVQTPPCPGILPSPLDHHHPGDLRTAPPLWGLRAP